jgi:hypothetical protein
MIYFIQGRSTGLIKIGMTTNVKRRFRDLQASGPDRLAVLAVISGDYEDAPYHFKFRDSWDHGEWFRPTPDLLAFIAAVPKIRVRGGRRWKTPNRHLNPATLPRSLKQPRKQHRHPALTREEWDAQIKSAYRNPNTTLAEVSALKQYAKERQWVS